ncbi:hypothetical protein OS493_006533 [Desmophyllum pertusum]|uniref:G-protein coupled receptors family 1 profile domain-containing protein n=1 Tax=Desmophyllum pertusum TaxID=174260 RepID=A0A9X0A5N7_9CNID|nr:hypothetical protein OS493_006533 [Desmophyllum pertusum]
METESTNGNSETSEIHISVVVILFVFSIFILVGNLLTIISILQFTRRKNTLSLLIVALSLTEVLNALGPNGIALYVFFDKSKDFHDLFTLCRVQAWTIVFLRIAATLIITLLGLDRVFVTALPHFTINVGNWKAIHRIFLWRLALRDVYSHMASPMA